MCVFVHKKLNSWDRDRGTFETLWLVVFANPTKWTSTLPETNIAPEEKCFRHPFPCLDSGMWVSTWSRFILTSKISTIPRGKVAPENGWLNTSFLLGWPIFWGRLLLVSWSVQLLFFMTPRIHVWYIYLHLVDCDGKLVGKYTNPMDLSGWYWTKSANQQTTWSFWQAKSRWWNSKTLSRDTASCGRVSGCKFSMCLFTAWTSWKMEVFF